MLEIAQRLPSVTVLLVGGEQYAVRKVSIEVESRNLKNIILTGFIPNAELPYFQAACDLLLMPYQHIVAGSSGGDISKYLSPMKLFEYMACGRPIIMSVDGDAAELIRSEGAGIACSPEDPAALASAVRDLYSMETSERERMGRAGRDAFLNRYSLEVLIGRYEELFEAVARRRASGRGSTRGRTKGGWRRP